MRDEDGMCEHTGNAAIPGPGCHPAESKWPGLHCGALRSHSVGPLVIHIARKAKETQENTHLDTVLTLDH